MLDNFDTFNGFTKYLRKFYGTQLFIAIVPDIITILNSISLFILQKTYHHQCESVPTKNSKCFLMFILL